MSEILLYRALERETIEMMMWELSFITENSTFSTRIYCEGGDVQGSWGIAAKLNELRTKGCKSIAKVDGMAASMAGVLLAFFDEREALAVSDIMIHRATYGQNEDGEEYKPNLVEKKQLAKINNDIKERLNQVIDNDKLKMIKGYTIDDLFDESKPRIDCWLNSNEAFEIKLITKVVPLDAQTAKYKARAILNCYEPKATAATAGFNAKKMTAKEFKEKDPECYSEIQAAAIEAYKAEEKAKAEAAAKEGKCKPEKEMSEDKTAQAIAEGVQIALAKLGIAKLEVNQPGQTAKATAEAEATKAKAKAEADKSVEELQKEVNAILTGQKVN